MLTMVCRCVSIREFCGLETPIIMFDVKGDYIALKLQEASARA